MTRLEEKLYFQSVFDAIDQVYKIKKPQPISNTYEERLRASFNKLIIPDWYNPEYTSINGLRKTKSHGHVPRKKRGDHINNGDNSISSSNHSPCLSNGTHRQSFRPRSPSHSWSERHPIRHDSTCSSYDTNGSVINGRRSTTSNGSSSYAPGVQRVAQSSTWYRPRMFTPNGNTNGHTIAPPKPLPRYSKIDQERIHSLDSSKIKNVRYPIKPRTMAQAQLPKEEESSLNISSDADVTLVQKSPEPTIPADIARTNSLRSVSSDAESYCSAALPPADKNLLGTDSSSYASVNERCLSPSTASYHTAVSDDTSSSSSSLTGYETPTPQIDENNATLSSHSSLSDLSHADTIEANVEDLDIVAVSTAEQKSVDIGMENSSSQSSNIDSSTTNDTRSIENTNWYDGSLETCIHQTAPPPTVEEIREISNENVLREVDINAVGDEFFLFSPRDSTDDEPSTKEIVETSSPSSNRIFAMEDGNINDPFDNSSSIMITNLDDILIDDDDDGDDYSPNRLLNANYRRPIQEDILYEVEHENSYSDNSQNTSSIIATDDKTSIKLDANIDCLTSTDSPVTNNNQQLEKQSSSLSTNDNNILPIYILPPLFTTSTSVEPPTASSSLCIETDNNFQKWDSFIHRFPDLTSPSAYTSKIRHRHYSVGSYYDHKTTAVNVHPSHHHPYYFLGSAPVSPLNRVSAVNNETHYHHHSPMIYDNLSLNALRRVNPFLDSTTTYSNFDNQQSTDYRSTSLNREERTRVITYTSPRMASKSAERTIPVSPPPIISPPSTRTSAATFSQYEFPLNLPRPLQQIPVTTHRTVYEQESAFAREKSPSIPPRYAPLDLEPPILLPKTNQVRSPPVPARTKSLEKDHSQNIYQEIDSTSPDEDQGHTPNADLQFIRGAIDRVFHFHGGSSTDTTSDSSMHYEELEESNQKQKPYPAVEAVQRFYNHKNLTDMGKPTTSSKSNSSTSKNTPVRKKTSEHGHTSSEEVDDTLNDIEEVYYHNEKSKRHVHTKTSQQTQTIGRRTVPPIDIVTEMIIEQDGDEGEEQINQDIADGDMVIFYDDIEIVEHSASSCSSESESSSSHHYSKPTNHPPPVPARTLKPSHLLNSKSPSTANKTYELEKSLIRKKFDVNSVNDMLNRTEQNLGPSATHRHPSARHFVGKLNSDDSPVTNGHQRTPTSKSSATLPTRSLIADTNALVKQIQNSLSRNSLHDSQINPSQLSTSNKDLRAFVSTSYSPSNEIELNSGTNNSDDQTFKRQARLSRSFHNVSEYKSTDQFPKKEMQTQPSKSVENNLDQIPPRQPLNLTSLVSSTSFSALPNPDENARMLSMKWYTGQVSENSEICYNAHHARPDDLLHGYISTHSNRETQELLTRLEQSNDLRIHAALEDIRSRVAQFDASKTRDDIHVFMRYLESRLRDLSNKKFSTKSNGHPPPPEVQPPTRQIGRQALRSSGNNGESQQPVVQPRRASQSSTNQENPAVFDDMLNTVLGLPKKGVSALPQSYPVRREKPPTQITTNTVAGRDTGKRLFESGTYRDPRLIYDGPKKKEKEEQPLETSV